MDVDLDRSDEADNWYIVNYEAGDSIELKSVELTFSIEQICEYIAFVVNDSNLSQVT
jgi:hypothetical protein